MRLVEYRILMPLSVKEYQMGQSWTFSEVSRLNTGGGEGVEVIKNDFFEFPESAFKAYEKYLPEYEQTKFNELDHKVKNKESKLQSSLSLVGLKNVFSVKRNQSLDNINQSHGTNQNPTRVNDNSSTCTSNHHNIGQYTYKVYRLASKLPWYIQKIMPKDSLIIHEKSWNMYPIIKTHLKNDYMKDKFHVYLDTIVKEYKYNQFDENVHNLPPEKLEKREIIVINISDTVAQSDYIENEDPRKFKSVLTDRGPLIENWWQHYHGPIICCYKLVDLEFSWYGMQKRAENQLINLYKKVFMKFHREIFCWIDKWYSLDIEMIRKFEVETQNSLSLLIKQGDLTGKKFEEENDEQEVEFK